MSEDRNTLFRPTFNRSVRVEAVDDSLSANAGVLLLREMDHILSITHDLGEALHDPRDPSRTRLPNAELLRERLFALACGYSKQLDINELAHDPAFRTAVWNRAGDKVADERLGSQSGQSRLLDRTVLEDNRDIIRNHIAEPVIRHRMVKSDRKIKSATIDVDALPITVYGKQEGAAFNGYYQRKVYAPFAAYLSPSGDLDDGRGVSGFVLGKLRNGDAAPAEGGLEFMLKAHERAKTICEQVDVRADAAFAHGAILDSLTDRNIHFLMRLAENPALKRIAADHAKRKPGRPPADGYEYTIDLGSYQASTWKHQQRLILVVVDKPDEEGRRKLFPDYFFLVTNWSATSRTPDELLDHYRQRGTFEDRFGELNQSFGVRLSSPTFAENEATFLLSLLAFNMVEVLRREAECATGNGWDLRRFQRTVLQVGARMVKGSHYLRFLLMAPFAAIWSLVAGRIQKWSDHLAKWIPRGRHLVPPPQHAHLCYHPRL